MTADSKKIDDGGLAFPSVRAEQVGNLSDYGLTDDDAPTFAEVHHPRMSLRQWFATHAPEPSQEDVQFQMQRDINLNPHNDYHKPARRGKLQIIAELKYAYADAMIAAGKAEGRS